MFRPIFDLPADVLRFLSLLGPEFEGFEIGAMAGDATLRSLNWTKRRRGWRHSLRPQKQHRAANNPSQPLTIYMRKARIRGSS